MRHIASLVRADNGKNLDTADIEAASQDEAWATAYGWAKAQCRNAHTKGRLILTGGDIHGSRSAEIDPFEI
ncbi:hypothetical protein HU675_0011515 [Bradyrhizobium septentrionale]|uniref:hypothetical protein n=1 Tax=Bradyrhizobium septentrionale TaxID=1404411 RepID=UPI001596872A|nr:hypothetical protein [Bradyrhizobium septentrionale]UGY27328.1 hypothetical protein HU675_0011515 [Bradyrhizobium septentrionale]